MMLTYFEFVWYKIDGVNGCENIFKCKVSFEYNNSKVEEMYSTKKYVNLDLKGSY